MTYCDNMSLYICLKCNNQQHSNSVPGDPVKCRRCGSYNMKPKHQTHMRKKFYPNEKRFMGYEYV